MKKNNSKITLATLWTPTKLLIKEISLNSTVEILRSQNIRYINSMMINLIRILSIVLLSKILQPVLKVIQLQNQFYLKNNIQKIYPTVSLKKQY